MDGWRKWLWLPALAGLVVVLVVAALWWRPTAPVGTLGAQYEPGTGVWMARNGYALHKYGSDLTGLSSVLAPISTVTSTGTVHVLAAGEVVYITHARFELTTASDTARVELGYTSDVTGTGTFTACSPIFRLVTGATLESGGMVGDVVFDPPLRVRYTGDTARCVTMRVQTNDASARMMVFWEGWKE